MLLQKRFRENVAAELKARGWSGCDLAEAMGVADSNVYQYLRESGRSPGLDVVQKFAEGLGLTDPIMLLMDPKAASAQRDGVRATEGPKKKRIPAGAA